MGREIEKVEFIISAIGLRLTAEGALERFTSLSGRAVIAAPLGGCLSQSWLLATFSDPRVTAAGTDSE